MEAELAQYIGVRRSLLVNSGSSANLLAVTLTTARPLRKTASARRRGDHLCSRLSMTVVLII